MSASAQGQLLTSSLVTLGHETNLARAPLWDVRARPVQLELIAPSILYGRKFLQVAGQPLTVTDQRLFAELTTLYVRAQCPDTRRVPFSLGWAAKVVGHETLGGETRRLVRASLSRLRSVTVESALREPDGHETVLGWGLLDRYLTTSRGGGMGSVTLSDEISHLLRAGSVTYLHAPTWDAISSEDSAAGRLWTFLEAEDLRGGRRYSLFAGQPHGIDEERNMPAIADLLRLDWSKRRNVASRVHLACEVICRHDPRYSLELAKSRSAGMWRLEASRRPGSSASEAATIPALVLGAWRKANHGRRPSARQLNTLREVLSRRSVSWVAAQLSEEGADPFRRLLNADTALSRTRLAKATLAETAWDSEKESLTAGLESVGEIMKRIASQATSSPLGQEATSTGRGGREFPGR